VSDRSHYGEYAEARHRHEGDYAPDRHDHDLDYAEKYHRHYDLETDDKTAQQAITCLRVELDELRRQLDDALGRIADLERLQPTCVICLDATATQQTVHGPACSDCAGEPEERPEPEPWDPGPETVDEGGMSAYRSVLPEDYQRGQS
jgi:hypothetical protein